MQQPKTKELKTYFILDYGMLDLSKELKCDILEAIKSLQKCLR